eukprot:Skav225767  [mRNA]  locus=scaffold3092:29530:34314:- [translate_table: standard]
MASPLELEPLWGTIQPGHNVDLQAEMVVFDTTQARHLCRSLIHRKFFTVSGTLRKSQFVSILGGTVLQGHPRVELSTAGAVVMQFDAPDESCWNTVIETCAGMSIMSQGCESCGCDIKASNELRPVYCKIIEATGKSRAVCGDIGERTTVGRLHSAWPQSAAMLAGFSCQPWSKLGDQKGFADKRASSLISTLRAAYFLRCHTICLECVTSAGDDVDVKETLKLFMKLTGFRMGTTTMKLENLMPAHRHRWWCVMTCPCLPPIQLQDLPSRPRQATVGDVLPILPIWPQSDVDQLTLDRYESNKIFQSGTFDRCLVRQNQVLSTALHGWANQLSSCPCGCRQHAMADDRLMGKGIFCALVLTQGDFTSATHTIPCTRHIHPWELATLHGVVCDSNWPTNMRLLISGLGQMATPIQSAWLMGQYKSQLQSFWGEPVVKPEQFLWDHFNRFFAQVASDQPSIGQHPTFVRFIEDTKQVLQVHQLGSHVQTAIVQIAPAETSEASAEVGESHVEVAPPRVKRSSSAVPRPSKHPRFAAASVSEHPMPVPTVAPVTDTEHSSDRIPAAEPVEQAVETGAVDSPRVFGHGGGLVAFATSMPTAVETTHVAPSTADVPPSDPINEEPAMIAPVTATEVPEPSTPEGATQEIAQALEAADTPSPAEAPVREPANQVPEYITVQVVHPGDAQPNLVSVFPQTLVGMFTVAEERLHVLHQPIKVTTSVGTTIPANTEVTPFQQLFLAQLEGEHAESQQGLKPSALNSEVSCPRMQVLFSQKGWVAVDEMTFYLGLSCQSTGIQHFPPVVVNQLDSDEEAAKVWIAEAKPFLPDGTRSYIVMSAVLRGNHWSPVLLVKYHTGLSIFTTPNLVGFFTKAFEHLGLPVNVVAGTMQTAFPNDCGDDVVEATQALLIEHGVPAQAAEMRAKTVVEKIGRVQVAKCLRSTHPWKDIKGLANGLSPKLQLVLAGEFADAIASRVKQNPKFGSKHLKSKRPEKQPKKQLSVHASDISVPPGVFKDSLGNSLSQITLKEIGPNASGIVVVDADEAMPYLRVANPVSKAGLALVIVDHMDTRVACIGSEVRLPARCERTSEPLLITAKLIQLGGSVVSRSVPDQSVKIGEVETNVIRTLCFRDEMPGQWDQFMNRPVKHIIQQVPEFQPNAQGKSPLIDVWDRQFLNDKMERVAPAQAFQFLVSFRVEGVNVSKILQQSGTDGLYHEPRAADGRSPDSGFRVVWLSKRDHAGAVVARQSTQKWSCLVRSNHRFGLRVHQCDAQEVHTQHKPLTPFLASDNIELYHGGPMPFGATRETLGRLFASWGWPARPLQPRQRSPCGRGMVWEIQATECPRFEVWQCEHSDVLITKAPKKEPKQPAAVTIHASARTIRALEESSQEAKSKDDPWLANDPWMTQGQGPAKVAKSMPAFEPLRPEHLEVIAKQVEQKLQSSQPVQHDMSKDDEEMEEMRMAQMEDRLAQLEMTVHGHHNQQSMQNQEIHGKIAALHQKVDQQHVSIQQHIDGKMDEQLKHIEKLLFASQRVPPAARE